MENAIVESFSRLLNDVPDTNSTTGDVDQTSPKEQRRGVYEVVALLCWFFFLVLCCIIPALCAYRRRRTRERRTSHMFLRGSMLDSREVSIVASQGDIYGRRIFAVHQERLRLERANRITVAIKDTTMLVSDQDLVEKGEGESPPFPEPARYQDRSINGGEEADPKNDDIDEEKGETAQNYPHEYETAYEFDALRLPSKTGDEPVANGSRNVLPACIICLCPYEVKNAVTWSPKKHCSHAFHQACIVEWLAKKEEPLCPVCRQEFCDLPTINAPVTENTTDSEMTTREGMMDV